MTFEQEFASNFSHLHTQLGIVPLYRIWAEMPSAPTWEEFVTQLRTLRVRKLYQLMSHDGRHGRPTDDLKSCTITECGRDFQYVVKMG